MQTWPNAFGGDSPEPALDFRVYRVWDHKTSDNKYCVWAQQNPSDGVFDFTELRKIIRPVINSGRRIHYTVQSTPTWLAKVPLQGTADAYGYLGGASPATDLSKLALFINKLLDEFGPDIDYIDVRNEPDAVGNTFWNGTFAELAAEVRTVYQTVKARYPKIKILSPSDWSAGGNLVQFLNASDGAGGFGRQWIDAVCLHPYYRYWHTDARRATQQIAYDVRVYMNAVRAQLVAGGLSANFPFYCMEIGYASDRNDVDVVASTPAELARWGVRIAIGWATLGAQGISVYAYETINSGNLRDNEIVRRAWQSVCKGLQGRRLSAVDFMPDGTYRCTTDAGVVYL